MEKVEKVVISIDSFGWQNEIHINGVVYKEIYKRTQNGACGKTVFKYQEEIPIELVDEMKSTNAYEIMKCIRNTQPAKV